MFHGSSCAVKVKVWESMDFVGLNALLPEDFMYYERLAGNRLLDSTDLYAIMEAMIYVFVLYKNSIFIFHLIS